MQCDFSFWRGVGTFLCVLEGGAGDFLGLEKGGAGRKIKVSRRSLPEAFQSFNASSLMTSRTVMETRYLRYSGR